jgi:3-methylcrotonyl-CoA carboxylase alpha subunit
MTRESGMFRRILVANRGEIACRIIRTAQRLAVEAVAIYSDADVRSLHVEQADAAMRVGGAAPAESYLDIEAVIRAALAAGAEAIHPGYGFLSENAEFAEACAAAGLVFIGPPPGAIRAMGSKSAAKTIMEKAGVPVVPGYHGSRQDAEFLAAQARQIGFPVLIKAVAGGGGKGMRRVDRLTEFRDALAGARRESLAAFKDETVLVEKYIERPRHVEVQVFADQAGTVVHLFDRDCSLQRRHQKILEEAPAPGLPAETRAAMGNAAVAAARAISYVGAGTVEFIYGGGAFHFMEMNTRLQVEHPVTELVTGFDLVEWQLRVAAGQPLPISQKRVTLSGHAIEARLYAEDPARGFLPATGTLVHLALPDQEAGEGIRIDTGVRCGDTVSIHYDPMIAKVIAWGEDREMARRRLRLALERCRAVGCATNRDFLHALVSHPAFAAAAVHTGFIEEHSEDLFAAGSVPDTVLAAAALFSVLEIARAAVQHAAASSDPHSPWHRTDGWRLNDDSWTTFRFREGDREISVTVHFRRAEYVFDLPGGPVAVSGRMEADGEILGRINGQTLRAWVVRHAGELHIFIGGRSWRLAVIDPMAMRSDVGVGAESLTAPMPGKIVAVRVASGNPVVRGQPLLVMEAMKMEHTIRAPANGIVGAVRYAVGDQVEEGAELIHFDAEAEASQ